MKEWSRGRLRHYHELGAIQFLTWRLRDSLPKDVVQRLMEDINKKVPHARRSMDRELDACLGSCVLRDIRAAKPVVDELTAFHDRVDVLTFVVMPNHVHVVASFHGEDLAKWVGTVKGRTGRAINRAMGTTGSLWQPEYFDRMVRDETHLEATCRYVEWNPVRSGLCVDPRDYPYSSANEHVRARLREADRNRG